MLLSKFLKNLGIMAIAYPSWPLSKDLYFATRETEHVVCKYFYLYYDPFP